jgi:hypothetical protein
VATKILPKVQYNVVRRYLRSLLASFEGFLGSRKYGSTFVFPEINVVRVRCTRGVVYSTKIQYVYKNINVSYGSINLSYESTTTSCTEVSISVHRDAFEGTFVAS